MKPRQCRARVCFFLCSFSSAGHFHGQDSLGPLQFLVILRQGLYEILTDASSGVSDRRLSGTAVQCTDSYTTAASVQKKTFEFRIPVNNFLTIHSQ